MTGEKGEQTSSNISAKLISQILKCRQFLGGMIARMEKTAGVVSEQQKISVPAWLCVELTKPAVFVPLWEAQPEKPSSSGGEVLLAGEAGSSQGTGTALGVRAVSSVLAHRIYRYCCRDLLLFGF